MLLKRTTWLLLLIFALHAGAAAQQAAPAPCHSEPCEESLPDKSASSDGSLTVAQYKTELDRLIGATDADELGPDQARNLNLTVPLKWTVASGEQSFVIDAVWIKLQLGNIKADKTDENKKIFHSLHTRLNEMRETADRFDSTQIDAKSEQAVLTAILSRNEFNEVHGATWYDRLKAKVVQWLFNLISRLFGSQAFPTVSRIFVWMLVTAALIVLAIMIYRVMKNNARIEGFVPKIVPVSAKPWSEWMLEARAAAMKGDWREAIHLSYWAGVSLLEARGMWKPDRARTPREYLRLLSAASEFHPTLTQLTRRFEVTWYGYKVADEQAFTQALAELEKLGCR